MSIRPNPLRLRTGAAVLGAAALLGGAALAVAAPPGSPAGPGRAPGPSQPARAESEPGALPLLSLALVVGALAIRTGALAARPRRDGQDPSCAAGAAAGPGSGA
jgi:hypothetical protein